MKACLIGAFVCGVALLIIQIIELVKIWRKK